MILTPLQKLPNNVGDSGKIIVDTGFEWLPKLQNIAQSGHTGCNESWLGEKFRHGPFRPVSFIPPYTLVLICILCTAQD